MSGRLRTWSAVALMLAATFGAVPAEAGRSCEERRPTAAAIVQGLKLAERTHAALEASGAQVVVLARAGQDLSKYGLRYSHLGFAYRQAAGPDGAPVWRVVHKLNQCGTAESDVYRQGLGEFFLDDPSRYEAAWVALSPNAQQQLLPLLQDNARAVVVHHRPYSMVSYAWGTRYQQSNQWAMETLAAAMLAPAAVSRQSAQRWLAAEAYQPTTLALGPLTRLGGRMTRANVAFDDHPPDKRFTDRIETVTVDSAFAWLQRRGLSGPVSVVRP